MSDETKKRAIVGGEFLIRETRAEDIFIPEEWTEEQRMIAQTCMDFTNQEVVPNLDRIDSMEEGLMESIMDKAGELGLLGISVPEDLGGLGSDFNTSMLAAEALGEAHSFSVAYGAHTGIGTLPILYYGNDEQRQRFIPKLATGEWKASYCLTEPSAGSDANSGKTRAVLSDDGKHYIINGQKMWITNAGFAHVFTVFARIDDDKNLSAFILTRDMEGISFNPEEKKMGIKGSSTRQVFFNNVKVPVENLLYERNQGFKIAVNILNIGRIKLAAGALGGSKGVTTYSIKYANEREQFGRPIAKYGAIKDKLARMATEVYVLESACYRASQNIEDAIKDLEEQGTPKGEAVLNGIASFAPECAMLKVYGSEVLDLTVDEGVQIHGGMGYSAETRIERSFRDARINRIFEGTNEINRMLTVDMILKKAMKGEIDLLTHAMAVAKELTSIPDFGGGSDDLFEQALETVRKFKKAVLMVAGGAAQQLMQELAKEQEILLNIADMAIVTYNAESVVLRTQKLCGMKGQENCESQINMMQAYLYDAADLINKSGKDALVSFAQGDEGRMMLMGLKRFTKQTNAVNIKNVRRQIADTLIAANEYCF